MATSTSPSISTSLPYLPLALLSLIVVKLLYNKFHSPTLRRIPGPFLAAYTKYWRLHSVYRRNAHLDAIRLHQKYGPLVRTAPNVVDVGDPAEIPKIYDLAHRFTKTDFYPMQSITWQKAPAFNVFSTRSPDEHRHIKRQIAANYSMSSLLQGEAAVDDCSNLFFKRLREVGKGGKEVDLGAWLQYYAFDVVGELTFAKKLGFLEEGRDIDGMMGTIEGMLAYAALCGQVPEWHTRLLGNPLLNRLGPAMENWNQVVIFSLKAINSRATFKKDEESAPPDEKMEDEGYDLLSKWYKRDLSRRDIMVHLSANVFAGSDTTAIALRSVIYHTCRNPEKKAKMLREIDDADKGGLLSSPVSYKETTTHLPYFCAVLKEAMRVHPSVGLLMERHVPPEGANICGVDIPCGTIVGINPWTLNYDPSNFTNPTSFIPERWLDASEAELKAMENILSFNFGGGARKCLGMNISLMEMHKVVPELHRRFRVELAHPEREWEITNHWFVQQHGLDCVLTPR